MVTQARAKVHLAPRRIDTFDFHFVTEGSTKVLAETENRVLKRGDLAIFRPGQNYGLETNRSVSFYHCHFHFHGSRAIVRSANLDSWARLAAQLDSEAVNEHRTIHLPDILSIKNPNAAVESCAQICSAQRLRRPGSHLAASARCLLFLFDLSNEAIDQLRRPNTALTGDTAATHVSAALDFLENRLAEPVSLVDVANHLDLNPEYLARVFKANTNYSIGQYIARFKIAMAKELILKERKSIKVIARSLGFADPLYFSRLFRRIAGCSPRTYRQHHLH